MHQETGCTSDCRRNGCPQMELEPLVAPSEDDEDNEIEEAEAQNAEQVERDEEDGAGSYDEVERENCKGL